MRDQNPDQNVGGAVVSPSQVMSAGLASAGAALVTSRFGVAGTLLGAALTTMIITGGSAILKAYLESVTGHVRKVPGKLKSRRERKTERYCEPATIPDRPDLRDNFMGRMRAALGWFSRLPQAGRRSILTKGAVAALVAFVICMGAVFVVEKGIGNSLSCGLWGACPYGAAPGIHPLGFSGTGAGSSLSGGTPSGGGTAVPTASDSGGGGLFQKVPGVGGQEAPAGGSSASPAPSDSGASPAPSDSDASPAPANGSSASPAPGGGGAEQPAPSDSSASPAAPSGAKNAPAGASPEPAQ